MKTIVVSFLILVFSLNSQAQQYNFLPKWKKGDIKKISITEIEQEFLNDVLLADTTVYSDAIVKVVDEDDDTYTLEILLENMAYITFNDFNDGPDEKMKDYEYLSLIYSIDKKTAEYELKKWKDVRNSMKECIDEIESIYEKSMPEMLSLMEYIFEPFQESFESEEGINEYMEEEMGYLFLPFNKNFTLGETTEVIESTPNPFNATDEISVTTYTTLESVNEEEKTCVIEQKVVFDLSEFKEMMMNLLQGLVEAMGADDSTSTSVEDELGAFDMDMDIHQSITFDFNTTWVTKVVNTTEIIVTEPEVGVETTVVVSTVTIE